ncbi:MAG: TlpA family protein disulfide reductase [Bacteroidetes bacterium]|nr:TlpA family protein disulfide reductase [Bacteroidota bacterium]
MLYLIKKSVCIGIILLTATLILNGQNDTTTLVKVGDPAPLFKCRTIDGKSIDIGKMKGKLIMVNFFATWCPPCNLELPVLQKKIWDKYKDNPQFVLIILGREHTEAEVSAFAQKKSFTMPFAADPKREIFSMYATQNIPRNIIIGKDGNILFQGTGFSEEEFSVMEKIIAEKIK